ncbi:MAG: tRNA (adenosine(37)-N6)-threonylcarbamoyltransferase complex dimerization subunit type 1 TsaB [Treponema sp.]|jgi:tRNA threonylcarbamoyladenosine biosynthesis protein TsaB|nr:tRNA (adenosine(37)-N6)-threonylcarbamoyltransferase complex dimerization subunit type 1 TsaB [Treponema sp.]
MNLLAVDTATSKLSAALRTEQGEWYFEAGAGPRHSELVMDSVDLLTQKAGLTPADLSAVLCMGGPGSFTGLRIGFSLAKGLALSLDIPFFPVPTLDCMAHPFSMWPGLVVPVIDAKKNAFFCALYQDGGRLTPFMDAEAPAIARTIADALSGETPPVLLAGADAEMLRRRLENDCPRELPPGILRVSPLYAGARALLELAPQDIVKNRGIFDNESVARFAGPEYIRKSDAELQFRTLKRKNDG